MPSITLEHTALKDALALLARVVEKKTTIPILANILLRIEDGVIRLKGTDLDIEAETVLHAVTIEGRGAITLTAATMNDIVRKLSNGDRITLGWDDSGRATLKSGRSRFTLNTLAAEDYPELAASDMAHRFTLALPALREMFATVDFAISTEATRYYLNGIYLHTAENDAGPTLRAVATDSHRLALVDRLAPEGTHGMPGVIVPQKMVGEIARMTGTGEAMVEVSAARIRITNGDDVLTSKLIDGTFPDYQRVIPTGNAHHAILDREEVAAAADRVSTIASERGRAVRCAFAEGKLALSVVDMDGGSAEEEITVDYAGPEMTIGFNARYLADCLAAIGGDTVRLALGDNGTPALFLPATTENTLVVLMPMRI